MNDTQTVGLSELDSFLEKLGGGGGNNDSMNPMLLMLMQQMRDDRAERRAADDRRQSMLLGLAPVLAPLIAGLFNKQPDPLMLEVVRGAISGKDQSAQMTAMQEAQRAASAAALEQTRAMFTSVMEMKDDLNAKMMEKALESQTDAGAEGGPAAIMREVRLGLSALASMRQTAPVSADVPALAGPAASATTPAQPAGDAADKTAPRRSVVAVVLHTMKQLQENAIPRPALAHASVIAVALNDEELTRLLVDGDEAAVIDYCLPTVSADPELMGWVNRRGVGAWISAYVNKRLAVGVADAVASDAELAADEGADDDDAEPEVLQLPPQQHKQQVQQPKQPNQPNQPNQPKQSQAQVSATGPIIPVAPASAQGP